MLYKKFSKVVNNLILTLKCFQLNIDRIKYVTKSYFNSAGNGGKHGRCLLVGKHL